MLNERHLAPGEDNLTLKPTGRSNPSLDGALMTSLETGDIGGGGRKEGDQWRHLLERTDDVTDDSSLDEREKDKKKERKRERESERAMLPLQPLARHLAKEWSNTETGP